MSVRSNYNPIDRVLHHIAFCHPLLQKVLSELESDIFASRLQNQTSVNPVFVTGLPRAGTTLLLELIYGTGEFATFTYRQMPFVLAPLLWNTISRPFRKAGKRQERAHGDGVTISFDSPEAFEEVLWMTYMGKKIVGEKVLRRVEPSDLSEEFNTAFQHIILKLLLLKKKNTRPISLRYLSKNNANISRLSAITTIFPDAIILIPFRHPLTQVQSLLNQHKRFLDQHSGDPFSQKYMKWIGHYEFGANLRPIEFGGEFNQSSMENYADPNFWMAYWVNAYNHSLRETSPNVHFIDFDNLLLDGESALTRIGERIKISRLESLTSRVSTLKSSGTSAIGVEDLGSDVWKNAQLIYEELSEVRL